MLDQIRQVLEQEGIVLAAPIALSDCHILRPYLLTREGIECGTAILMAIPYATESGEARNLSAYAAVPDYHLYFKELFDRVLPQLRAYAPDHRFIGFADHSPIDEVDAACRAGLGVRGNHGLLLTERYSSFIFLGEIITDAILPVTAMPPSECHHCGACLRACPVGLDKSRCLSALTQKKGTLTQEEVAQLTSHPLIWGCDICQEACPYTAAARAAGTLYGTPAFFREDQLSHLSIETLDAMAEEDFARRAYAWRGRQVIRRNLLLQEDKPSI